MGRSKGIYEMVNFKRCARVWKFFVKKMELVCVLFYTRSIYIDLAAKQMLFMIFWRKKFLCATTCFLGKKKEKMQGGDILERDVYCFVARRMSRLILQQSLMSYVT
mmetsp:Transcript_3317/g.4503  ORF Transcript_3317/g.4503 Transcript_3317/m.4503 type:complete len:106 (-) Transcript_3317:96-413(-)